MWNALRGLSTIEALRQSSGAHGPYVRIPSLEEENDPTATLVVVSSLPGDRLYDLQWRMNLRNLFHGTLARLKANEQPRYVFCPREEITIEACLGILDLLEFPK